MVAVHAPPTIPHQYVVRGESWTPDFLLRDEDGDPIDLSVATIDLHLRIRHRTSAVAAPPADKVRKKSVGGQTGWITNGTDGQIMFLFEPAVTAAWATGMYDVELVFIDTVTTPDTERVYGRGLLKVIDPETGTLP